MYRHSGGLNMGAQPFAFLPSPAQEDHSASESESETIAQLDRKRRQLDEEIAHFKIQKEKEFRDFEQDLRRKRKRKRSPANGENHHTRTPPTHPSVLSLLGSRPQANGHANNKQNQQQASRPQPVPSKPTLSVEKLTIVGTTAPPATAEAPPSALARSLIGTTTPPRTQNEKLSVLPPTPTIQNNIKDEAPPTPVARDHNDPFAGVFTPSYLPLLDSRSSGSSSIPQIQTYSAELSQSDPNPQITQPGSESSSLPSSPTSPRIPSLAKRSYTAPLIPSTSLPSALRVASGDSASTRKRKHVMFRLADSAVVEPSSSYEEMSSPDLPSLSSSGTLNNGKAKSSGIDSVLASEEIPWSWSKGPISPIVEKDINMNIVGDGEDDDEPLSVAITGSTLAIQTSTNDPITAPGGLQFDEAPDGGSGVGFFELEEELDSPSSGISTRVRSPRSNRNRFFDDWGAIPDEDEEMEMAEDQRIAESHGVETHTTEEDLAEEMTEEGDDDLTPHGLGISATGRHENHASAFASGSVPIDIVVRPSSSWIGSFGAGSQTKESNHVR